MIILLAVILVMGSRAYATSNLHATSYYDDKVDHYEHEQMMSDFIDEGIR